MAKIHADPSNRNIKGLAGLFNFANKELMRAALITEKVFPNKTLMSLNWQEFSTVVGTSCHSLLFRVWKLMPGGWSHEALWIVFLAAITVKVLKTQILQRAHTLHKEYVHECDMNNYCKYVKYFDYTPELNTHRRDKGNEARRGEGI